MEKGFVRCTSLAAYLPQARFGGGRMEKDAAGFLSVP